MTGEQCNIFMYNNAIFSCIIMQTVFYVYIIIYMTDYRNTCCLYVCSGRTGVVKAHSLKIGLVALCHGTIQEKYACESISQIITIIFHCFQVSCFVDK